jgi:hypothetical protein
MTSKAGAVGTGRVFISYSRKDQATIRTVASELDQLGQEVWLDEDLSGGQRWWDAILEQIRNCTCFVFGLSETSLNSLACRAELDYANALQRPIIPVLVGPPVPDPIVPPLLAEAQRVDATNPRQLARALLALPSPPPLPDPLPVPPPVPISYMDDIADRINQEHLTVADQHYALGRLKQRMQDEDMREAAVTLLRRLRRHQDLNAFVAEEIDAELTKLAPPPVPPPAQPPPGQPPPAPPPAQPPPGQPPPGQPGAGRAPQPGPGPGPTWYPPPQPGPQQPRPQPPPPAWPPGAPLPHRKSSNAWIWILVIVLVLSVMFVGCLAAAVQDPTTF